MKLLADFGQIDNPFATIGGPPVLTNSANGSGLVSIFTALIRTSIMVAGLYVLINIIIAGYTFLGAGGDPKKVQQAWEKIYLSFIGMLVIAGSLILSAIIGWILLGDPGFILRIQLFAPQV